MAICHLACDESQQRLIQDCALFHESDIREIELPITGQTVEIDLLIAGSGITNFIDLAATISDWNIPPATLFIIKDEVYADLSNRLHYHPRIGRSIFHCRASSTTAILEGLKACHQFYTERSKIAFVNSASGHYTTNNISPRWLFQTLMEHLDEYIYFKDTDSKFLAVSRYLTESCGKKSPSEILGLRDFDLFDSAHSKEAYQDERKIALGEIHELYKEEKVIHNGHVTWVATRKLPLHTRSNYLAGSFGLSRDITKSKDLHDKLEEAHERMHSELLLARKMQESSMQQSIPLFNASSGSSKLEIATHYRPSFHLSGDFYSISKAEDGNAMILIADVMGHGVRAAMVTAMIQLAVQQLSDLSNQPSLYMARLNEMLHHTIQSAGQILFATAAYCYIDLNNNQLSYVQAGGNHGLHLSKAKHRCNKFNGTTIAPALGLLPNSEYISNEIDLNPGDEIILYTDGIIEASNGRSDFGERSLQDFFTNNQIDQLDDKMDRLLSSLEQFTGSKQLEDDLCLIGLRIH
ncbi:MAG TPA: hypothetical protein DCX06_10290 [Opitutae bacterium]|nr:hypothetical protein [Opitutae bacterium]